MTTDNTIEFLAQIKGALVEREDGDHIVTWWIGRSGSWKETDESRDPPPHKKSIGWEAFCDAVIEASSFELASKDEGAVFCASDMDRGFRGATHVGRVCGLTVDIDDPGVDASAVRQFFDRSGLAYLMQFRGGKIHVYVPIDPMEGRGRVRACARVFLSELRRVWPGVDLTMARPEQPTYVYAPVGGSVVANFRGGVDGAALDLSVWACDGADWGDDAVALPGRRYLLDAAEGWIEGSAPFTAAALRGCHEPHRSVLRMCADGQAPDLGEGERNSGLHAALWSLAASACDLSPDSVAAALYRGGVALDSGAEFARLEWWRGRYRDASRSIGIQRAARRAEDSDKGGAWVGLVTRDKSGRVSGAGTNAALILRHDPDVAGALVWDQFADVARIVRPTPWGSGAGPLDMDREWVDCAAWLRSLDRCGALFARGSVLDGLEATARAHTVDPLKEYLEGLEWDGMPRIGRWLVNWLGADDTEIVHEMGRRWLISGAARGLSPGCQADSVLVLQGDQGIGKSSAFRILSRGWYTERIGDPRDKDSLGDIQGVWIVEIAELEALRNVDLARLKAFLTSTEDKYRAAFERTNRPRPRRCIFGASTNEDHYLSDPTGARRWWPVTVRKNLDQAGFTAVVDQLWAEAVAQYRGGAEWHLTDRLAGLAGDEAENRREISPIEESIIDWDPQEPFTLGDALAALGISKTDTRLKYPVLNALRALGYRNDKRIRGSKGRKRYWIRPKND